MATDPLQEEVSGLIDLREAEKLCDEDLIHAAHLVKFDNGEIRVFNCLPLMDNELFSMLRDPAFFETVHVDDMGLVCWDDATDINPYMLYDDSVLMYNINELSL